MKEFIRLLFVASVLLLILGLNQDRTNYSGSSPRELQCIELSDLEADISPRKLESYSLHSWYNIKQSQKESLSACLRHHETNLSGTILSHFNNQVQDHLELKHFLALQTGQYPRCITGKEDPLSS